MDNETIAYFSMEIALAISLKLRPNFGDYNKWCGFRIFDPLKEKRELCDYIDNHTYFESLLHAIRE